MNEFLVELKIKLRESRSLFNKQYAELETLKAGYKKLREASESLNGIIEFYKTCYPDDFEWEATEYMGQLKVNDPEYYVFENLKEMMNSKNSKEVQAADKLIKGE